MKKFVFAISIFLQINCSLAQWNLIEENAIGFPCYHDIEFVSDSVGYVVTYNLIGKTENAGSTWSFDSTKSGFFDLIDFINADTGIVCCYPVDGTEIILTIDGGSTWSFPDIEDVSFYIDDIELLTSGKIKIIESIPDNLLLHNITDFYTDYEGTELFSGYASDIDFSSVDTGYMAGFFDIDFSSSNVIRTYDGGLTWIPSDSELNGPDLGICFPTSQVGYGYGDGLTQIWKSEDYGNIWELLEWDFSQGLDPHDVDITNVYFYNKEVGFVVTSTELGDDVHFEVLRTINGGMTWDSTDFDAGTEIYVTDIFCTDPLTCYMTTCNSGIYKTLNGGGNIDTVIINEIAQIGPILLLNIYPNPAINVIKLKFPNDVNLLSIKTMNAFGEIINLELKNNEETDIMHIPAGIYVTEAKSDRGIVTKKWVKF